MVKASKTLYRQLQPESPLHKNKDLEKLKQLVGDVEKLVKSASLGVGMSEVQFHLDLAIKAIGKEKPAPAPSPKPELNLGEDECGDYDEQYDQYDVHL